MAKEYRILLGLILLMIIGTFIDTSNTIWFLIFISVISIYSLYRHSTIYQKFRIKDNRYFIKSKYDKPYGKKKLYWGIAFLSAGLIYFMCGSYFELSDYLNVVIISSLLAFGLTNILSKLFFTASPITEILINSYSIEIIRHGSHMKEFHSLTDFKVTRDLIILESGTKRFVLSDLDITKEQQVQLVNEFDSLKDHLSSNSNSRKNFFSLKRL